MTWPALLRRRSRREWAAEGVVFAGLAGFVVLVYLVVVLGGGLLMGHTSSPLVGLSVVATAIVALAFDRVQTWLESLAARTVLGGSASPYDVLRTFSRTVTGSYQADELPTRMAQVLAEGTCAEWSQVWLVVGDQPSLAATWPPEATRAPTAEERLHVAELSEPEVGRRSLAVRHDGELLGVLVVQERSQAPLTSVELRLFEGLASQAGLVLRGARLRAELRLRAEELSVRAEELRTSRQRLVDAQDEERRLLERDIHDGAQQHLVALAVNLRLAETLTGTSPQRARELLAGQQRAADEAIATLVALSRGIYPTVLGNEGLAAAVRAAVVSSVLPVEVTELDLRRYAAGVEATAYFTCLEAVQNAAKHSGAQRIRVRLRGAVDSLELVVEDDGIGFDVATTSIGTGFANMRDRVQSAGGKLSTESTPGAGTAIRVALPAAPLGDPFALAELGS